MFGRVLVGAGDIAAAIVVNIVVRRRRHLALVVGNL